MADKSSRSKTMSALKPVLSSSNSIPVNINRLSLDSTIVRVDQNANSDISPLSPPVVHEVEDNSNSLSGVFVCTFDTSKGNTLSFIEGITIAEAEGIEYKAIASGLHKLFEDYIYFKQNDLFGLALFHKMDADSSERGARMGSVGFLSLNINSLHAQFDFLKEQAQFVNENPGKYDELIKKYKEKKAKGERRTSVSQRKKQSSVHVDPLLQDISKRRTSIHSTNLANKAMHENLVGIGVRSGSFPHFFKFFGPAVFQIWKAIILHKRVLFYTPVPLGQVCDRVASACMLLKLTSSSVSTLFDPNILFYVNVFDIDKLKKMKSFIACTTEKIFVEKKSLYDVFVDGQNVTFNPELKSALRLTSGDLSRYKSLLLNVEQRTKKLEFTKINETEASGPPRVFISTSNPVSTSQISDNKETRNVSVTSPPEDLEGAYLFEIESLNRKLFEELQLASQEGRSVHSRDMPAFGLESDDKDFFRALVESYEMRVVTKFSFIHYCLGCCF